MSMSKVKVTPQFNSEAKERAFWGSHDSCDYIDWRNTQAVTMPNLKRSTKTISLRLPGGLRGSIEIEANKRDMPYQSLIKSWLVDYVKQSRNP